MNTALIRFLNFKNEFSIICVKGHLNRKKEIKNPYLSSNEIWISAVSFSADTHTNPNISTNSKPNLKIFYILGCESGAQVGSIIEKTRDRQSRATVPLKSTVGKVKVNYSYLSLYNLPRLSSSGTKSEQNFLEKYRFKKNSWSYYMFYAMIIILLFDKPAFQQNFNVV